MDRGYVTACGGENIATDKQNGEGMEGPIRGSYLVLDILSYPDFFLNVAAG